MNLDEARSAFITESHELLDQMEAALLELEQRPADQEIIAAIFRAAHTIKGSAGIFGLDAIVSFTHVAESVLDVVRAGRLRIDAELSELLLKAGDHIRALVACAAASAPVSESIAAGGEQIQAALSRYLGTPDDVAPAAAAGTAGAVPQGHPTDVPTADCPDWHLSLRFGRTTIQDGFDPLSFIHYLTTFGQIMGVVTLTQAVPRLSEIEPDECHLGFEIRFRTEADQARIEAAFEFVREDSRITVLPPHAPLSSYFDTARATQTDPRHLGDLLVRCGSLQPDEVDRALATPDDARPSPPDPDAGQTQEHTALAAARPEGSTATPASASRETASPSSSEAQVLRVDAPKLDRLIDLVGELIIAGAGATLVARRHRNKEMVAATTAVARLMEVVRDAALDLRMVQIGGTFNRFQRMVRDVSRELGKDIALQIAGADTELDKTVVERLADPLTHLVRNAMDHGIESAEERLAQGKTARGTVRLNAFHEAGWVVVEVSDDGAGLRRDRILQRAVERGLVQPDAVMSEADIFQLIFHPGFSTAERISNLSGRGVGMDVVKRNITALRGTIDIRSTEGQGTTIALRLPLTLAIIDGFMMAVGKASYVVPLDMIVECIDLPASHPPGCDWMDLRGDVLPLIRLRTLFDIEGEARRRQSVVVVSTADQRVGLVVDQLLGELQTVIKPLGAVFQRLQGIAGFTILGSGSVSLLLDVPNLVKEVVRDTDSRFSHQPARAPAETVA